MSYPVNYLKVINDNHNDWPLNDAGELITLTVVLPEVTLSKQPTRANVAIMFHQTIITPLNLSEIQVYDDAGRHYGIVGYTVGGDLCTLTVDPTY